MKRLFGVAPLVAWLAAASIYLFTPLLREHVGATVTVPLVSLQRPAGDVVSNVQAFVIVLMWAMLASLLAEPAKSISVSVFGRRGAVMYAVLVLYQATLVADTIRAHVIDWWLWLGSFVGVSQPMTGTERLPSHFPWLSLVFAVAVGCTWYWLLARTPGQFNAVAREELQT